MSNEGGLRPGFTLTEHQRVHIANRLMLQLPNDTPVRELAAFRASIEKAVNGIPGDVLFALETLRLLADQGNVVARDLFDDEVERLGLTRAIRSYTR